MENFSYGGLMIKKILLCFVLALIFTGIGVSAEGNDTHVHTVRTGENLHILAERFYENSAFYIIDFIVEYNNIPNPDRILVGTVLRFPPLPQHLLPVIIGQLPLQLFLMDYVPTEEELQNAPTHTVVAGDNLTNLVYRFYGNSERYMIDFIARINGLTNPNRIHVGMILMFPELPRTENENIEDIIEDDLPTLDVPIEDLAVLIHQTSVWLNPPPLFLSPVVVPTNIETFSEQYNNNETLRLMLNHFMQNFGIERRTFMQVLRVLGYIAFDMNGSVVHVIYQIPINNIIFRPQGQSILAADGHGFIIFSW